MFKKGLLNCSFMIMGLALSMHSAPVENIPDSVLGMSCYMMDGLDLDEVVVTATRTPKALKNAPVVTLLISESDISKADATNVQDLLTAELPGLEFGYSMSQETCLQMNGFGGNAVLFLVDGERLAGETMDNVDYHRLNLDNVGRIEIVKGAASALYGANAVAGVVNIITKDSKESWSAKVNSRYNDFGKEWRYGGNIGFNVGKWNSQTSFQRVTSEMEKLTDAFDMESNIRQVYGGNTLNVKERLVYSVSDSIKLIARGGYFARVSNRVNYDDHYKDYSGGIKGLFDFSRHNNLEVSYSYDQYDKSRYIGGVRTHDHDYSNRQNIVHAMYSHGFGLHNLTVGGDYMNDYLKSYQFVENDVYRQHSADAFAQFDYNPLSWLNVVAALRYDYYSASDEGAVTGRLAVMLKKSGYSVRLNYAGGFRAPTLKELYMNFDMAGIQMIYGNPDLKPEKSHNFNIALEHYGRLDCGWLSGQYSVTATGYFNKYNSRITTVDYAGSEDREPGAIYANENGVEICGLDFSGQYSSNTGLGLRLNYTYQKSMGNVIDTQFSQPRPHSATWRIDYDKQICKYYGFNVALSGRYMGKPDTRLEKHDSAYQLWKVSLQQRVYKGIAVNIVADNIFNYRPKVYYWNSAPTNGATFSVGLTLDIDKII